MDASFPIQTAAKRTGLSAHVIRAWERRYQAIDPQRSKGRHRLYTEAEIERLTLLHRAVELGHNIGRIARLSMDDLRSLVSEPQPSSQPAKFESRDDSATVFCNEALRAVERFDAGALEVTLRNALLRLGFNGVLRRTIAPLAEEIGEKWRNGSLTAAHEHFFTAWMKAFLGEFMRQQHSTPLDAPRIVVGTLSGQLHELGALMAAAAASNLGWRAVYLGPSLSGHEIAGAALRNEAAAIALSIVYPGDDPNLARDLRELPSLLPAGTRIFVGGRAAVGYLDELASIGAIYVDSIEKFADHLDALRHESFLSKKQG
jgi:DNA-binding transcriptional MerR regulator/methylmalonyl-CoA mutase cobalamin-binding subunit